MPGNTGEDSFFDHRVGKGVTGQVAFTLNLERCVEIPQEGKSISQNTNSMCITKQHAMLGKREVLGCECLEAGTL